MRILVAGGAGYVGSALCPRLRSLGHDVLVVDLCWFGDCLTPNIPVMRRDLFDLTHKDIDGFDIVIFLAGLSNDPMADYSPAKNFQYNAALPAYLAFESKRAGVKRFIYASSCSVYGYTVNQMYDETAPVTSSYPYGISKLQGERGVMQQADEKFSVIALRKGTISGHSPKMRFDLVVNTMTNAAKTKGQITVNNASLWRPILSIEDAVSAYCRAVEADLSISGVFNVASHNHTLGEIAELVQSSIDVLCDIKTLNIPDLRNYKVSTKKAADVLSFHPSGSIKEIVKSVCYNWCHYGDTSQSKYYNIKQFQEIDKLLSLDKTV